MASEAEQAAHDDAHRLKSAGQEDARALEHQASHDGQPGKATKATEAKLAKHRDLIVVSLTLVGIIIGYLSFRQAKGANADDSSSAGDTTSADATDDNGDLLDGYTSTAASPNGYVVGSGDTSAGDAGDPADATAGLASYFNNIGEELGGLEAGLTTLRGQVGKIPTSPHLPRPIKQPGKTEHPRPTQHNPKTPAKKAGDAGKKAAKRGSGAAKKAASKVRPSRGVKDGPQSRKIAPRRR